LSLNQWNWYLINKINPSAQALVIDEGSGMMTVRQYTRARNDAGLF
jgi:hypothetical protein